MQYRYVALASLAALAVAAPVPTEEMDWNNPREVQDLAKRTFPFFTFWKEFLPSSMLTAFEDKGGDAGGQGDGGDSELTKRAEEEQGDPLKASAEGHHPKGVGHHGTDHDPNYWCWEGGNHQQKGRCIGHHPPGVGHHKGKGKPPGEAEVSKRTAEAEVAKSAAEMEVAKDAAGDQVDPIQTSAEGHHPKGVGHHGTNTDPRYSCWEGGNHVKPGGCIGHHPPGVGHHKGKGGHPGTA